MCSLSAVCGGVLASHVGHSTYSVSYADFISILLTAISLMLAILAFVIGILAFIGWSSISSKVGTDVSSYLRTEFRPGKSLHAMLRAEIASEKANISYEGTSLFDTDFAVEADAQRSEVDDAE